MSQPDWKIFTRDGAPHDGIQRLLDQDELCPPWRNFKRRFYKEAAARLTAPPETDPRGETFRASEEMAEMVNAALYLRRPLLITGKPGTGKSSLIYAVARQLGLGKVLRWPVNSRSALKDAIYSYDAIARLQDANLPKTATGQDASPQTKALEIGKYLRLGALGTALLPFERPRALLIDEIDKSDVDLPNDLLNIFEEGEYTIPELARLKEEQRAIGVRPYDSQEPVELIEGQLRCLHFPFVVLTSNGERDFSAPFLRRCLRMEFKQTDEEIRDIVKAHLGETLSEQAEKVITKFIDDRKEKEIATDQLLNAVFLVARGGAPEGDDERKVFTDKVLRPLNDKTQR